MNSTAPPAFLNSNSTNITLNFSSTSGKPVLFRDDWYKYYYNYYGGQFYSYYEDRYMTKVNATLDEIRSADNSTAAFNKYCSTTNYTWNATSETYYFNPNASNSTSRPTYNYEQYYSYDPTISYQTSFNNDFYDPSTMATGSYANYYYNYNGYNNTYDAYYNGATYYQPSPNSD